MPTDVTTVGEIARYMFSHDELGSNASDVLSALGTFVSVATSFVMGMSMFPAPALAEARDAAVGAVAAAGTCDDGASGDAAASPTSSSETPYVVTFDGNGATSGDMQAQTWTERSGTADATQQGIVIMTAAGIGIVGISFAAMLHRRNSEKQGE